MEPSAASSAAQDALRFDPDLIRKYDGFGPRYTSYPTADRFHAGFTAASYVDALAARNQAAPAEPLSLYVHLPFCNTICYYCACNKIITANRGRSAKYVRYVGHVYTRDHNAFNATPRAVLNVTRESMARYGFSPPTRVFEAAGAGACLITDAWEGIELFLDPGREVLVAQDGPEVAAHVARLSPAEARAIGERARRRIMDQHTYARRAAEVERVLEGIVPASSEVAR